MSFPEKLKAVAKGPCSLKIIQINDVYKLDWLPYYKACKEKESLNFDGVVIGALPGDFLSPSALSSLDRGASMVDCLNLAGMDYVSFGNHESDIPFSQLINRIRESKFTWINTNMKNLNLPKDCPTVPEFVEIEIKNDDHTRRVALLGLITDEKTLYLKGAFGGAEISPLIESAKEYHEKLMKTSRYDAIIPLTHETIEEDRKLLEAVPFPVVIGGHDHEPFTEVINGGTILKMGQDATHFGIIELTWMDPTSTTPLVSITSRPAIYYKPDPVVQEQVRKHTVLLERIRKSPLFAIPKNITFSTETIRAEPCPAAEMLLNIIRDSMKADCCIWNAGAIRGKKDYSQQKEFYYIDLETEMPFSEEVVVLPLPGSIIKRAISETRAPAFRTPPEILGGYAQTDGSITWDSATNTVTAIGGEPIQDDKIYQVATPYVLTNSLRENLPILEYCQTHLAGKIPNAEALIDAKHHIVSFLSKSILFNCIESLGLAKVTGGDGDITKEDMLAALEALDAKDHEGYTADKEVARIIVNNLFAVADLDDSGKISKNELIALRLGMVDESSWESLGSQRKHTISTKEAKKIVAEALQISEDDPTLLKALKDLDKDGSGEITAEELRSYTEAQLASDKDVLI